MGTETGRLRHVFLQIRLYPRLFPRCHLPVEELRQPFVPLWKAGLVSLPNRVSKFQFEDYYRCLGTG